MSKFMMYTRYKRPSWLLPLILIVLAVAVLGVLIGGYQMYHDQLRPLDTDKTTYNIVIATGSTPQDIAAQLKSANLIHSVQGFTWYVRVHHLAPKLQAGTYAISSSESIQQIVAQIVGGKIVKDLVIILPGQRLDQVKDTFVNSKFTNSAVEAVFQPQQYSDISVLADKPADASLEGYLYPDTFQKDTNSDPSAIVRQSLTEMDSHVTPALRAAYAAEGLSVYQAVTLASVVEQEVSRDSDRPTVAQVFLKRLHDDMPLGSDVTLFYSRHVHDSRYDTTVNKGLPPGPISNVTDSALRAVAYPSGTDWLYFVSGDDGNTYFSHTLQEHEALTQKYCHKLCSQ